ncbi:MAG: sigma-54-dependent transcriptional regulator [Candidatus Polarisedimenticolia bacterium]
MFDLEGHRVLLAADGLEAAARLARDEVDLLILDLEMPGKGGLEILEGLRGDGADTAVIVLTGHGSIERAVRTVKQGAHDFLEKPPDPGRLLAAARNALRLVALGRENRELRGALAARHRLAGEGPAMTALRAEIARAAPATSPVLITGESGTGKELVARAVHDASARRDGPFVAVNCAAIPAELFESELFGHEKGAFTGALRRQTGRFERAASGTLFLDEIGEVPASLQAKLLRALDTMTIERLGGDGPVRVDARIVAATNRDLRAAMAGGVFRQDLYYRLAVLPIVVPPLRQRREEIGPLARHFLDLCVREGPTRARELSPDAIAVLEAYDFPGNVRELRNLVERLALLAAGPAIAGDEARAVLPAAAHPPFAAPVAQAAPPSAAPETPPTLRDGLRAAERALLEQALERNRWQMTKTARELGLERSHLYRKLKTLGIRIPD